MVAMVITPTNTTLFEANVDGLLPTVVLATNNGVQAFGGALAIGGDPGAGATPSTRSFGGSMSSVAIFTNALSAATLQSMFLDGFDLGNTPPPVIVQQPPSANILLYSNVNVTLTASGYGAMAPGGFPLAGGYWQKSTTPGFWTILTSGNNGADIAGGADTTLAGVLQAGALQITNVSTLDVGSYETGDHQLGRRGHQQRGRAVAGSQRFRAGGRQLRGNRLDGWLRRGGLLATE